jgi:hypothetical protein
MVLPTARRSSDARTDSRADAHDILRVFLARPITGVLLVVPLLGAFLEMGSPQLLMTISGAAALWLAIDLLLAWFRRSVPVALGGYLNLVAWTAGLGVLAAAGWKSAAFEYHGELVALVGAVVAVGVGLGSPRMVTVVWALAASTAVALGASMVAPLTVESAIAPAAIAVGAWFGAAIGVVVDRLVPAYRASGRVAASAVSAGASVSNPTSGVPARVREHPSS